MRLFIPTNNISKAVTTPNVSTDTVSERRNARKYDESFSRVSQGVSGDSAAPDNPEVGAKWQHEEENSLDNELEEDRKKDKEINSSRGVVKSDKVKKASEATDVVKSLTSAMQGFVRDTTINPLEVEFMKSYFDGCTDEDIKKGRVSITGRHRQAFNEWLCSRLVKDPNNIYRRRT